jgi:hypothetical protein
MTAKVVMFEFFAEGADPYDEASFEVHVTQDVPLGGTHTVIYPAQSFDIAEATANRWCNDLGVSFTFDSREC